MSQDIEIILYGRLRPAPSDSSPSPASRLSLAEPTDLKAVIDQLDITTDNIQMAMLNHRAVSPHAVVSPGDRLALFPKEYPIFVDWNDFRF